MQDVAGPPRVKKGMPTWAIVLLAIGGVVLVLGGTLAVLAAYSYTRFIAASKTAEAKNTIGAIARAASSSYEDERMGSDDRIVHRLCASSNAVPASFASITARAYAPSAAPGADFQAGDDETGWKCLRFSIETPIRFQYRYTTGKGYLVPQDAPGPDGFEASAQGDIDGDGVRSTYVMTGSLGPLGSFELSRSVYVENDLE